MSRIFRTRKFYNTRAQIYFYVAGLWLEIVQGYVQKLSLSKSLLEQSQALLGKLDTAFITQQGNTKKEKQIYDGYTRTVP